MTTPAQDLFAQARELPAAERDAFLAQACGDDAELHLEVQRMLVDAERADSFFGGDDGATLGAEEFKDSYAEKEGDVIGPFKLREQIGEGGFGSVWVADQEKPVRRRVALKLVKAGMDSKQVLARFEAERQALAIMDHPNIATIFDAGTTPQGRPYFVMELVRGVPITDYCDQKKLDTIQRLELFILVCQAVQHAHQKGIIHRDLKPSNILVTVNDGKAVPKVIDFGVAKVTQGRLIDATIYTQFQQMIGTPLYMSPEQAEMTSLDIDTRSDIYALGVLLYELLTGHTPIEQDTLARVGLDEIRRIIREVDPPRPSMRMKTLADAEMTTAGQRRNTEPTKIAGTLRGDIDWIVMKCLEKDRGRRYDTANGLAMDLQRHLANEVVVARPPTAGYLLSKLIRRHKFAFVAGAAIALAMLLGIVASTWQAVRAKRAETLALQARADAEKLTNFILDDFYAELEPSGQFETVARLARQALTYYDNLPASLKTEETARDEAAAKARLALATVRQGDVKAARPLAAEAMATLEQMLKQGDQSEATIYAAGLALEALGWCGDTDSSMIALLKGAEMLRPIATAANGSRRVKLQYANLICWFGLSLPPEQCRDMCDEALRVLAGLGALDLSDLSAASAWADVAETQARAALHLGQMDDAERLEKQVQVLAAAVLARRPADLRTRAILIWAPQVLALIEAKRFNDDAALQLLSECRQAGQDYLRFNPTDAFAWSNLASTDVDIAALLFRGGRVAEALGAARAARQRDRDPRNTADNDWNMARLSLAIALWEAQRDNRAAADVAFQEARETYAAVSMRHGVSEDTNQEWAALCEATERQIKLAFGENATVYAMATKARPRLNKLLETMATRRTLNRLLYHERQALEQAARAALNLGHHAEAETAARALLALHPESGVAFDYWFLDQAEDVVLGRILLAQAAVGQGRKAEALSTLEPAVAHYREDEARGAAHVTFRQHFARALYVQALAQPADAAGTAQRRAALAEAAQVLGELTDEARQLLDTKELLAWIEVEQSKLAPALPIESKPAQAAALPEIPYLGQPVPGLTPERFAPGIVCTPAVELNGVFSPDGREFYFTRLVDGLDTDTMHQITFADGKWGPPKELLLFPNQARAEAADMALSADGQELYFLGKHPNPVTGAKPNYDLWVSRRVNGDWATAELVPPPISTPANELYPILGTDGSLYFASDRDGGLSRKHPDGSSGDIYRSPRLRDGSFGPPVNLGPPINGEYGAGDMCLAPDESFLVISLKRPETIGRGDLHVSFRRADGGWGEPISLGATINTVHHEWCPMVTPDGKYLFFSRWFGETWETATDGEVYWVDIRILDQFRPKNAGGGAISPR